MAREQVLVQLTTDLLALLDERAVQTRHSRSRLIREAVERYLTEGLEGEIDERYVEAYTCRPQVVDAWTDALARRSLAEESW